MVKTNQSRCNKYQIRIDLLEKREYKTNLWLSKNKFLHLFNRAEYSSPWKKLKFKKKFKIISSKDSNTKTRRVSKLIRC